MGLYTKLSDDKTALTIAINGKFDFNIRTAFRDAYSNNSNAEIKCYVVDLCNTTYVDSSALGMLLILNDFASKQNSNIKVVNPNTAVRELLNLSNFDQIFEIQ